MENLLPRHLEIIYKINHFHMEFVASKYNNDWDKMAVLSIIEEEGGKRVNMAHLAIVGNEIDKVFVSAAELNGANVSAAQSPALRNKGDKRSIGLIWPS